MTTGPAKPKTTKAERTRAKIVGAALELFREHGYEATTMRAVAENAGVSIGNAYYYFRSKELLLQAFYHELNAAHFAAAYEVLETERGLQPRLLGVMNAKLAVIEPYHRFSGLLFRTAADPHSPLNPFHEASDAVRAEGEVLFARVLEGTKVPKDLAARLPGLLWTYSLGIVLFWIHDESANRVRTRRLIDHTCALVVQSVRLAGNPLMRPLRRRVLQLLEDIGP